MNRFFKALILFVLFGFFMPFSAVASNEEAMVRIVKVGFFKFSGYHEINEKSEKSGYGYDFLTLMKRYSNVNYEYVGYDKSWKDMQQMLLDGEIDMVTSAHKTPQREELFDYSMPIGRNSIKINIRNDDERFKSDQFETYDGMVLGLLKGNSINDKVKEFAKANGFTYKAKYYDSDCALKQALAAGEIDAAATSSLRRSMNEKTISEFDTQYFYAIVKKGNKDLLSIINYAINQMDNSEGDWKNALAYDHFVKAGNHQLVFTKEEQRFIRMHKSEANKILVATDDNWAPFSELKNGEFTGIVPDYFARVMKMTGMKYEYVKLDHNVCDAQKAGLKEGMADIYLSYTGSLQEAETSGYLTSSPVMPLGAAFLRARNRSEIKKIGISRTVPYLNTKLPLTEKQTVVEYDDSEDAVEAVKSGDIDAAYLYAYDAVRIENKDRSGSLLYELIPGVSVNLYAVMPDMNEHILLSIISKCINQIDKSELEMIVSNNLSIDVGDFTIDDWIVYHPMHVLAAILFFTILILLVIGRSRHQRSKIKFEMESRKQERFHREQIEMALKVAEHANQSKTVFLNSMSHDIRTPMNGIIGMTAIAKTHLDDPEKVKDCLTKITGASKHLLSLINDILDISRIESGTVSLAEEKFNLLQLMDNMVNMCAGQAEEKHQELKLILNTINHKNVIGDPSKLQQIFLNVVGNAIKYTPEGGCIKIEILEKEKDSASIADFEFICNDNGRGMHPEFVERIFEPFARADDVVKNGVQGTGLGMVISRNLSRMMGGDVKVESEYGKGSSFTVSFSLKVQQGAQDQEEKVFNPNDKPLSEQLGSFEGKRLLLVEDNELNREIALEIIGMSGAEIDIAENGQIAVEKFMNTTPGYYDMIFMDIQMPVMDGFVASKTIRTSGKIDALEVPIVAMSANAFVEDKNAARKAGMNDHVAKPVDLGELMRVMNKYLKKEMAA